MLRWFPPGIGTLPRREERAELFELIEGKFAGIAKVATVVTGANGFCLLHLYRMWHRNLEPSFWWIHAVPLVWLVFTLVLFVLEPYSSTGGSRRVNVRIRRRHFGSRSSCTGSC